MEHDEDLAATLREAAAGDQAAWDRLVARFSRVVWGVVRAHRLPAADAADVFQLTWLRLLDRIDTVREPARLGAWLATTARHECHGVWRRTRRLDVVPDEVISRLSGSSPPADEPLLLSTRDALLWGTFAELSPRCREVLRALVVDADDGRPDYAAVAAALGMPIGSLGPTRRRCLDQLRLLLTRSGI